MRFCFFFFFKQKTAYEMRISDWSSDVCSSDLLTPHGEEAGAIGGGLAYYDGKLFVSTGYGDVLALQPSTGKLFWVAELKLPIRGAPTVDGGRVFVITLDNKLNALKPATGQGQGRHSAVTKHRGYPSQAERWRG